MAIGNKWVLFADTLVAHLNIQPKLLKTIRQQIQDIQQICNTQLHFYLYSINIKLGNDWKKIQETSQCPHFPHYLLLLYLYCCFFLKHNRCVFCFWMETNYVASKGEAKENKNKRRALSSSRQVILIIINIVVSPCSYLFLWNIPTFVEYSIDLENFYM